MAQQKMPLRAQSEGQSKKAAVEEINTQNRIERQGFSAFPCAGCDYFKLTQGSNGQLRRLCTFYGEKLTTLGVPGCVILRGDA